jgi:hypothetical protein
MSGLELHWTGTAEGGRANVPQHASFGAKVASAIRRVAGAAQDNDGPPSGRALIKNTEETTHDRDRVKGAIGRR